MQVNNFKKLQEEQERIYIERHEQRVKAGLVNSLSSFRLVGQMIDIYLPKIFSLFVMATGGKTQQSPTSRHTSTPPSQVMNNDNHDRAPGTAGTDPIIR